MIEPAGDNAPENLRQAILADARNQADQMILHARQEAQDLLAKAATQADKARQERLDAAQAEAGRQRALLLARIPVESGRRRSTRVEALLQAILDEARARLAAGDGIDGRRTIVILAAEALGRMTGDAFVARCAPADVRHLHDDATWVEEIAHQAGRPALRLTLVEDAAVTEGGVIVEDADGRQVWDNRLAARLDRLWPQLRLHVAIRVGLAGSTPAAQPPRGAS
jgi:vacuolar-type H+-ATPase subunit E/Vma4